MIFDKHERCVGVRLWSDKTRFIQLWFCPPNYEIKPHSHPNEHVELMYICGKTIFYRKIITCRDIFVDSGAVVDTVEVQNFKPRWYNIFKRFTISPGVVHWFKVSNLPLVFVNFATFTNGNKPTSAAIDFKET